MSARLVTLCLAAISMVIAIPLTAQLWISLPTLLSEQWFDPFMWGALIGGLCGAFIFLKIPMIAVLEHELTHLCIALCLFRKPLRIVADPSGGETVYEGRGSVLIRLAPYILPTTTLFTLLAFKIFNIENSINSVLALGITWGYHLVTGIMEASPRQTDLKRGGLIASYGAVISLTCVIYPAVAMGSINGWPLVSEWLNASWIDGLASLGIRYQ